LTVVALSGKVTFMTLLYDAVMASWAAYNEDLASPKVEDLGYKNVIWLPNGRGFLGTKDGRFTVAVRGTAKPADFVTDARIAMRPMTRSTPIWPNKPMVHCGFDSDTNEIIDVVLKAWVAWGNVPYTAAQTPLVTGHSLGASVANELSRRICLPMNLITFGSPRVGNADFRDLPHDHVIQSIRVVHDRDLIPTLPISLYLGKELTYVHFDTLLHLTKDGQKLRWWHRLLRRLTLDLPLLEDHPIHLYSAAVKAHEA